MAENFDTKTVLERNNVDEKRVGVVVRRAHKGYSQVEMLSTTSLLFAVGSGESPEFSPRRVFVLDAKTGDVVSTLHFTSSVLAIRARRDRYTIHPPIVPHSVMCASPKLSLSLSFMHTHIHAYIHIYTYTHSLSRK